jgi:hypothetical protein
MAQNGGLGITESFKAAADYSAKQYFLVKVSAADTVTLCSAAADRVVGVILNEPAANQAATIGIIGIFQVYSDGSGTAIAAGDYVGTNTSGKGVKKATADYSVCGIALDASSADGTLIRVLMIPGLWFRSAGG